MSEGLEELKLQQLMIKGAVSDMPDSEQVKIKVVQEELEKTYNELTETHGIDCASLGFTLTYLDAARKVLE